MSEFEARGYNLCQITLDVTVAFHDDEHDGEAAKRLWQRLPREAFRKWLLKKMPGLAVGEIDFEIRYIPLDSEDERPHPIPLTDAQRALLMAFDKLPREEVPKLMAMLAKLADMQ